MKLSAAVVRFGVVGLSCYLCGLVLLYIFSGILGFHYLISMVLALLLVNFGGWAVNRKWTFKSDSANRGAEFFRYLAVNGVSSLLALALMALLVDGWKIHYLMASVWTAMAMMVINFLSHRHFSFMRKV